MMRSKRSSVAFGLALLAGVATPAVGRAQTAVTVDVSKVVNPLTTRLVSTYAQAGDSNLLDPPSLALMRSAGLGTVTFPTGWNSLSQQFHWSTNKFSGGGPKDATDKPYVDDHNNFGHMAQAAAQTGMRPVIVVNYGSNAEGTGGGSPQEAAAWVAYANGKPDDAKVIGKDAGGTDWKTVGYWASMRAAEPLPNDDGYNFLRQKIAEPLHIQLWQVGEDEANNGFYPNEQYNKHNGTFDLHAPYPPALKDIDRRHKAPGLSARSYGEGVAAFSQAMKAVDPTIFVGATLTLPTVDNFAPDWNPSVLKAACKDIDFTSYIWTAGKTAAPDYKSLDEAELLGENYGTLGGVFKEAIYQAKGSCPAGHIPRVLFSEVSAIPWATVEHPMVPALFAADMYAVMAESGVASASWYQLREGGLFDKANKPTPVFFATQMLHIIAFKPGDAFVSVNGTPSGLLVHATRRQDGLVGVIVINKDGAAPATVKLNITGADLAGGGLRFEYAEAQRKAGAGPVRTEIKADGNSVTTTVPPYGMVDLLLPRKK